MTLCHYKAYVVSTNNTQSPLKYVTVEMMPVTQPTIEGVGSPKPPGWYLCSVTAAGCGLPFNNLILWKAFTLKSLSAQLRLT